MATQLMPPPDAETRQPTQEELAVRRLEEALTTCWRLEDAYRTAIGTSMELSAWARLRGAREDVSARERWLRWVRQDDDLLVIRPAESLAYVALAAAAQPAADGHPPAVVQQHLRPEPP